MTTRLRLGIVALAILGAACSSTDTPNNSDQHGGTGGSGQGGSNSTGGGGQGGSNNNGGSNNAGGNGQGGSNGDAGTGGQGGSGGSSGHDAGSTEASTPAGETGQMVGMTAAHNAARATIPVPDLTWSNAVAADAEAWANGCQWKHDPTLSQLGEGQNLFAFSNSGHTPQEVVDGWMSEKACYNYANNTCTPSNACSACGHYTQVVWKSTTTLGCFVKECSTGSPFMGDSTWEFWVCNYKPPGNYNNQKPY